MIYQDPNSNRAQQWRPIPGYEDIYDISSMGSVYSRKFRKTMALNLERKGYVSVELWKEGKNKRCKVHRLVAITFIPNPDNKRTVNHINSIRSDNRVDNLEWATQSENIIHAFKYGNKDQHGERHSHNKLTESQVREIRKLKGNKTQQQIAEMFNVSRGNIGLIHRGLTWSHIQD